MLIEVHLLNFFVCVHLKRYSVRAERIFPTLSKKKEGFLFSGYIAGFVVTTITGIVVSKQVGQRSLSRTVLRMYFLKHEETVPLNDGKLSSVDQVASGYLLTLFLCGDFAFVPRSSIQKGANSLTYRVFQACGFFSLSLLLLRMRIARKKKPLGRNCLLSSFSVSLTC